MDINTLILVVILGVMVYAMLSHGQEKKLVAESEREQNISEKEELSHEEVASYGQVQDRKSQLFDLIDENLAEHPEQSSQLKEIIEEWANLKIEAFQNRRSWVRATPEKE
tara:strand:- start:341 stop:670 length:330 start_codon:yes stop_codon:yes gene_type:complete